MLLVVAATAPGVGQSRVLSRFPKHRVMDLSGGEWLPYENQRQEEDLRGQVEQRGSKYLWSPVTFVLWPSQHCPFISDPLASCFWSMLDFQEQKCMYIIRARDEQKQVHV